MKNIKGYWEGDKGGAWWGRKHNGVALYPTFHPLKFFWRGKDLKHFKKMKDKFSGKKQKKSKPKKRKKYVPPRRRGRRYRKNYNGRGKRRYG